MKAARRTFYFFSFVGLAIVGALALNRVVQPSCATELLRAAALAAICTAPGLLHRRLWPLALLLLPVGCYLLLRTTMALPTLVDGAAGQYHFYVEKLRQGSEAYKVMVFPLDVERSPELLLLLTFSAYWLLGSAGFLALGLRRPLPAVVLVMILVGYGLTVDTSARALWPGLLFLVLAASLLLSSRALERLHWRPREALMGVAVAVVGCALSVGILSAAPSVVATPWQDWRAWDPFGQGGTTYSFNWLQNYPTLLDPANNLPVLEVQSPYPCYWRANALDNFTGSAWVTSRAFVVQLEAKREQTSDGEWYTYSVPPSVPTPKGPQVVERFSTQSIYTNYLFTGGEPLSLAIQQEIPLRMNDLRALRVSTALGPTFAYTVTATIPQVQPSDLVGLGKEYPRELAAYLTLPFDRVDQIPGPDKAAAWRKEITEELPSGWEWAGLYDLNERIVGHATDPYQVTLRIERYLRRAYSYSLTPRASEYSSPYAAFLFDTRAGYCQHFAGAMALLLRYNGIPARVALGFATGEKIGKDLYQVTTNNAHAWVEVYFPTVGWVAFDPTPGHNLPLAGPSSTSPGFVNPFADTASAESETATTLPPAAHPAEESGPPSTQAPTGRNRETSLPWVLGVVGLLAVAAGWPLGRDLWRGRALHWGPWEKRLALSIRLLRSDLQRYGVPAAPGHTYEELLDLARDYLGLEYDPSLSSRVLAVLFGAYPPTPQDFRQAEALRKEVRSRLRRTHRQQRGWTRTALCWYGLRRQSATG